jgi:hypothetical protein
MRILTNKKAFLLCVLLYVPLFNLNAQNLKIIADDVDKLEKLLHEKRKFNTFIALNEHYKIQIYSGEAEKAKKNVALFKQEFINTEATIVFNTPNYKVWVGSYKTRMEAEKNMLLIKKKYKNLLLIKPNK